MNLEMFLKIYTFVGSTVALYLALLKIRDRYPHLIIKISKETISLPVKRDSLGGFIPDDVHSICVLLVNRGRLTLYPQKIYLLAGDKHRIEDFYDRRKPHTHPVFSHLDPNRSFEAAFYCNAVFESLPPNLRSARKITLRAVCLCEDGRSYKSKTITVVPASLQPNPQHL